MLRGRRCFWKIPRITSGSLATPSPGNTGSAKRSLTLMRAPRPRAGQASARGAGGSVGSGPLGCHGFRVRLSGRPPETSSQFLSGYPPSGASRVAPPSKLEDFFPLPNPTRQGSSGFLQQACDPAGPVRYLATKETVGRLEECTGVVEGKPLLPRSRDVGEILLGKLPPRRARPVSRYRKQSGHRGETREKA